MANFNLNDDDFFNTEKITQKKEPGKKKTNNESKVEKQPKKDKETPKVNADIDNLFSDDDVLRTEAVNFRISKEEVALIRCAAYRLDYKRPITDFCREAIRSYIKSLKKDKALFNQIAEDYQGKINK